MTCDHDNQIDIHSPAFVHDPYPTYAELREQCPVVHSDLYAPEFGGFWLLTGYDDVKRAALDWRTYTSSVPGVTAIPIITRRTKPALPIELDPPLHSRYRALVAPVFSNRRMEQLRPRVQAIVESLVEPIVARGSGDLASDLAVPLSVRTLAVFTGLPEGDTDRWVGWMNRMFNVRDREDGARATAEFESYISELITARRSEPADDFLSMLMAQEVEGHHLSDEDIRSFSLVVFGAGFETTADALSVMLWWLAEHPAERQWLLARPDRFAGAVEEFLRYITPIQIFGRNATCPVKLHNQHIQPGEVVALAFGSANHDPTVFDEPEHCRLDRSPNPHLAFGAGVHLCLGAAVARMEMSLTLQVLAQRLPNFAIPPGAEVEWKTRGDRRGLQTLPVVIPTPGG